MSVKKKLGMVIVVTITIMVGCLIIQYNQQQTKVTKGLNETVEVITAKSEEEINTTLSELANTISQYMVTLEDEVDNSMLYAAYYLQEVYDSDANMSDEKLKSIAKKLNMTDFLISNSNGDFIYSTDPASKTLNLFDIWDGYAALLDNPDLVLPSNLKISAESGSIYKYTAIPRKDGKGCLEAALNSDAIKEEVKDFSLGTKGFSSLIVVDSDNTVIMKIGEDSETASFEEGKTTNDSGFSKVFSSGTEYIISEETTESIYYPVHRGDDVTYAMKLTVETAPYFEHVEVISNNTKVLTKQLAKSLSVGIIINLCILIIMSAILIILISQILKPIVDISKIAEKISHGFLNMSVDGKHGGEIGVLVKAFNDMTADLRKMLTNVKSTSNTIKDSSNTIRNSLELVTHSSTEISNATEEISQGTFDLAQDNTQVYENTSELSTHLENMISNIENVNGNITKMEEINNEGRDTIVNLDEHFENSIHAINEVEKKIVELQEKSRSISEIVNTIGGIATQTNLLALNASIEAARAGEQGKGFAVVADEVRNLAESSTHETQEISNIIKEIINIVESTTERMGFTKQSIAETSEALSCTKEVFDKLSDATSEVGESSLAITDSIAFVSEAKNALLNLVESISAISEESAASSKEVSESTSRQSEELEGIKEQIVKMDEIVGELNELISKYTV
ncbi:methyl-accepting chemotaxis protein [Velocimicrobium porci]|nr:methyl-accepting chemotaxis protein [Velocimicrobium porci]